MVEFCEAGHRYTVDGVVRPSVTTILKHVFGAYYQAGPQRVIGRNVHLATQWQEEGSDVEVGPLIAPYLVSLERLLKEVPFQWTHRENIAVDSGDDLPAPVPGKVDRIGQLWRHSCVADLKTGAEVEQDPLQLVAYVRANFPRCLWPTVQRYRIGLRRDGRPARLREYRDGADFDGYVGAVRQFYGDPDGAVLVQRWRAARKAS